MAPGSCTGLSLDHAPKSFSGLVQMPKSSFPCCLEFFQGSHPTLHLLLHLPGTLLGMSQVLDLLSELGKELLVPLTLLPRNLLLPFSLLPQYGNNGRYLLLLLPATCSLRHHTSDTSCNAGLACTTLAEGTAQCMNSTANCYSNSQDSHSTVRGSYSTII